MKKWYTGLFISNEKGHRHDQLTEFANSNKLQAGELVVFDSSDKYNCVRFMYFAEKELT